MSARAPVGASNRSDLFSSRSNQLGSARDSVADYKSGPPSSREGDSYAVAQDNSNADDPLQLEHMLGYTSNFSKTVVAFPHNENMYMKSLGALVAIEDLSDPHGQSFLRGHDMPVSAMTVSRSGSLIATGQVGTKNYKGTAAPIFLWETDTRRRLTVLRGLVGCVVSVAFSDDEQFLCGCDSDGMIYVWEVATAEVVYGQRLSAPASCVLWADQKKVSHNVEYELAVGIGTMLNQGLLKYDSFRMQWLIQWTAYHVPPNGGLSRQFQCIDTSQDRVFLYIGTHAGEMMVYRRDTLVFRACIPVCTNGVHDIVTLPDDSVICGGGDGTFHKLVGRDMAWKSTHHVRMDGMVRSISLCGNKVEMLVACSSGSINRCLADTLSFSPVSVSNTSSISCIAFPTSDSPVSTGRSEGKEGSARSDGVYFATGTKAGEVRVWDLTDYSSVSGIKFPKSGAVNCIAMVDNNHILSGWGDGHIRCTDVDGRERWSIPTAHRDGTTSIAAHIDPTLQYFVTGGGDGAIRVWKYSNRELITQYSEHRKGVAKVIIDTKAVNVVHSVGGDCSVLSYDLKAAKRIICHIVNSGSMLDMTQRKDAELECITCDTMGRLLHWDIDIRDPVMAVQDASRTIIRACAVSPSGRFLAFAGDDQIMKVMDVRSNEMISMGYGHSSAVLTLSWTPDERQIISGGSDSSLCIWNFYLGGDAGRA